MRLENERVMTMNAYDELQKIWGTIPTNERIKNCEFDIQKQKKLLDIFHIGEYYYMIVNVRKGSIEMVSPEIEKILGYKPENINLPFLGSIMHPEDLIQYLNFEAATTRFFNCISGEKLFRYKVQNDFRLRKADGAYLRMLNQFVIIQHDADNVRTFVINTDITHLKKDPQPLLSFIGLDGEPSYYNVDVENIFRTSKPVFTPREKDIVSKLAQGMNSSQISENLHISKHTVDSHRKNMLKKTGSKSTCELISNAFNNGWV